MEQVCYTVSARPKFDLAVRMAFKPERLKEVRELKGYTQEDVAAHLGVSYQFYSAIERGKKNPNTDHLASICEFLSCSSDYLLGFSDKPWERLEESKMRGDKQRLLYLYDTDRLPPIFKKMLGDPTLFDLIGNPPPIESGDEPDVPGEKKASQG